MGVIKAGIPGAVRSASLPFPNESRADKKNAVKAGGVRSHPQPQDSSIGQAEKMKTLGGSAAQPLAAKLSAGFREGVEWPPLQCLNSSFVVTAFN